ncbi:MAG: hypothetical protein M3Y72_12895 [Acidobacteriota bacterium]|nr:hypothetical protein [Acidobacteriota bacterium]
MRNTFGGAGENGSGETLEDKELILWNKLLRDFEFVTEWLKRRHGRNVTLTYDKEDLVMHAFHENDSSAFSEVRPVLKVQLNRPKKSICIQHADRAKELIRTRRENYAIRVNSRNGNLYFQSPGKMKFDSMTLAENLLAEKLCFMFLNF